MRGLLVELVYFAQSADHMDRVATVWQVNAQEQNAWRRVEGFDDGGFVKAHTEALDFNHIWELIDIQLRSRDQSELSVIVQKRAAEDGLFRVNLDRPFE